MRFVNSGHYATRSHSEVMLEIGKVSESFDDYDLDRIREDRWLFFRNESSTELLKSKLGGSCLQSDRQRPWRSGTA